MKWTGWRGFNNTPCMWYKVLVSAFGRTIHLHKFVAPDQKGCFHSHPAIAYRLVLWGGYIEELKGGDKRAVHPRTLSRVDPSLSHRVECLLNGKVAYSLWFRGRKTHKVEITEKTSALGPYGSEQGSFRVSSS